MRIDIRVNVRGEEWSGPQGESSASVETESDLSNFQWELLCASLVQIAIANYEAECASSTEETPD